MKINEKTIAEALNNENFSFLESFADAADTQRVTKEMTLLLFRHRQNRELLKVRERQRVQKEQELNSARRKAYVNTDAPNERTRTIMVEIETEELEFQLKVLDQQIKEMNRVLQAIKLELDTLKSISYSLRTEMGTM